MKLISTFIVVTVVGMVGCAPASWNKSPSYGSAPITNAPSVAAAAKPVENVVPTPPKVEEAPTDAPRPVAKISFTGPAGWHRQGPGCSYSSIEFFSTHDSMIFLHQVLLADPETDIPAVLSDFDPDCEALSSLHQEGDMYLGSRVCGGHEYDLTYFAFEGEHYAIVGFWPQQKRSEGTKAMRDLIASFRHSDVGVPVGGECK
jgi:hypothetical protein